MDIFEWQDRQQSTPFYIHMFAGSIAGIAEHIVMLPFDNIKTHCQAGSEQKIVQIINKIYRTGGIKNFYSGSSVIASGCAPAHALSFSIYQYAKDTLECEIEQNNIKFAAVGAMSSLFHDLIMTPSQVVKQRLQLINSGETKIKSIELIKYMYQKQGIKSFYRSLPINYFLSVPFGSLIVLANQTIKNKLNFNKYNQGYLKYYLSAGVAGMLASIPTCPFDVIKTKLNTQTCINQCQGVCVLTNQITISKSSKFQGKTGIIHGNTKNIITLKPMTIKYHNVLDTCRTVMRQQGISGFFKGLKMRMMIQSFSSAIAWGTYQILKQSLKGFHQY